MTEADRKSPHSDFLDGDIPQEENNPMFVSLNTNKIDSPQPDFNVGQQIKKQNPIIAPTHDFLDRLQPSED